MEGCEMGKKQIFRFILISLLLTCSQFGCNNITDSTTCSAALCHDVITAKLLPTENYLPGQYSVELIFSDGESIIAEFELIPVDENDNTSNLMLHVIENDSYRTSWSMFDEFEDPLVIHYSGRLLAGDLFIDYEFTEEVTVNVKRDGNSLLSKQVSPDYSYYWCNSEEGKCDPRQNKDADIEVLID
jgi:hypothetical protein